jgi:hypothetical protein
MVTDDLGKWRKTKRSKNLNKLYQIDRDVSVFTSLYKQTYDSFRKGHRSGFEYAIRRFRPARQ